jgi:hypothetical protein
VMVPTDPKHPIRRIEVHSGSAILARRPFVPGVDAAATLELPDDSLRLGAERELDLLCGQLIETVARRSSLIGRGRAALNRSDFHAAKQVLADLDHLPSADDYKRDLNKIRVLAVEDAQRRKDRMSERRIDDLCQKTLPLFEQYLPAERIETIKEEINAALAATQAVATPAATTSTPAKKGRGPAALTATRKKDAPADSETSSPPARPRGRRFAAPEGDQAPSDSKQSKPHPVGGI